MRRDQECRKTSDDLRADAPFDEIPSLLEAELLIICLLVAFGPLDGFLFQPLTPFLIPDFLDFGPFFGRHFPLHFALFARLFFRCRFTLALPFSHALADEVCLISSDDVLLRGLPQAFLFILLAQCPLVRTG